MDLGRQGFRDLGVTRPSDLLLFHFLAAGRTEGKMRNLLGFLAFAGFVLGWVDGFQELNVTEVYHLEGYGLSARPLMVGLALIQGAAAKGAVCLDGTLPAYHLHRGYGSGANSWLIQLEAAGLYFRGQRIWLAAMEDLMSKGMRYANQALLSGCSAGGLASILHCDEFRQLFPGRTKVKCLADAGLFLDAIDVSGGHTLRSLYAGVVNLQDSRATIVLNLFLTQHMVFPGSRKEFATNLHFSSESNFAYDSWQLSAFISRSRLQEPNAKCCERFCLGQAKCAQAAMLAVISPLVHEGIAQSVGDWYFDRAGVKAIDCPYPCDKTCHHLVFK
ncbi:hypothetical protein ACLOJK_022182 [Asimina triloba]